MLGVEAQGASLRNSGVTSKVGLPLGVKKEEDSVCVYRWVWGNKSFEGEPRAMRVRPGSKVENWGGVRVCRETGREMYVIRFWTGRRIWYGRQYLGVNEGV
jgi:hypothetical protein